MALPLLINMRRFQLEKEGGMRKVPEFVLMGILAVASLLVQACATQSGSSGGDEQMARAERIDEPTIKHISTTGVRCADLTDKPGHASGVVCP